MPAIHRKIIERFFFKIKKTPPLDKMLGSAVSSGSR